MASNANNEKYDFVETPSDKYYCPVTFELLTDPRQTSECCGNRLSGAAAEQLEAEGKPCPLCKKAPLKTTMDLCFKREVMELKVYCSKKSAGCEWKGELGELECHLKLKSVEGKCRFVDVQCPLECGKRIQRRHLQDHQSDKCEKRPFNCKYCDYKATYEKVVHNHWPKCERYPEVCPNKCSDEVIERQFLQRHLDEKCQLQEIQCKYSPAGCQAKMTREAMKAHLETKMDEHVIMVLSGKFTKLESKIKYLILALTLIVAVATIQKNTLIPAFTQNLIAPKPVFIPLLALEIVMNDFDKLKNDRTRWYSSPLYTHIGGYKMCLCIDANGWGAGRYSRGVSVRMMKGDFDDHLKWPFRGEITFHLVNQKEGGEHMEKKLTISDHGIDYFQRVTESDVAEAGRGYPQFISHTDLYKPEKGNEYLKNDTLIFEVTKVTVTGL